LLPFDYFGLGSDGGLLGSLIERASPEFSAREEVLKLTGPAHYPRFRKTFLPTLMSTLIQEKLFFKLLAIFESLWQEA